jgi:hypothetical protein
MLAHGVEIQEQLAVLSCLQNGERGDFGTLGFRLWALDLTAESLTPKAQSLNSIHHGGTETEKTSSMTEERRPRGFIAIGVFFVFGATMAVYAAITLAFPGTVLDVLWALNQRGHEGLAELGRIAAVPFMLLSAALARAAVGWFGRRRWGWILGVAIIGINMAGDLGQLVMGEWLKGVVGVVIAGALLFYMMTPGVRKYFGTRTN